jgi:hypothetical protein
MGGQSLVEDDAGRFALGAGDEQHAEPLLGGEVRVAVRAIGTLSRSALAS